MRSSILFGLLTLFASSAQALQLQNTDWQVDLDPATLALSVTPEGQPSRQVSSGVTRRAVSALRQDANQASWQWASIPAQVSARLNGPDLEISLTSSRVGTLPVLSQPASAYGQALLLPLGEGFRIPFDHVAWRNFLLQHYANLNTSQDLSLPLWSMDYGHYSLSWLLTNPFNNTLHFRSDDSGLALDLSHEFTALDLATPMTLTLSLSRTSDPLAGAKRYRQWLQQQGQFVPLSDKLTQIPDSKKLLGASYVYLWGNTPITNRDVRDPAKLVSLLRAQSPFITRIRSRFDPDSKQVLTAARGQPDSYQLRTLVRAINQAMADEARKTWQVANPDWKSLGESYRNLMLQLKQALGPALTADAQQWGGGLSLKTIATLKQAGLTRLWLGVDNWEGGLWHPAAVQAGVRSGYLMAAYDSYQTTLAPGQQPDWTTAQLGGEVHQRCGIMRVNGAIQAGFQQSGYYTNPRCVRSGMQARISALTQTVGFNSWFLDAYATGMVFDDYRNGQQLGQRQMASAITDNMAWVGQTLKLPLGSEDGNATTSRGVVFAHGMQTPVMGWVDPDLQKNANSPYFLGRWYPAEQPETFFKPVELKPAYAELYFAPATRLPLYQTVFHDSIITTNHWLYDNFKFSNVDSDNRLMQMLYNVAPLYHLSADTLSARLARMRCTDTFFRPVHQSLATQALTGFSWLSDDRQVQQTRFADGSVLIANFSSQEQQVNGEQLAAHSVSAHLSNGLHAVYSTERCH